MASYQNYPTKTYETLRDVYRESAKLYAANTLFMQKENGAYKSYTYRRFANDVEALGTALCAKGLLNAHIMLIGENCYHWALSYLSVICGVGVVIPTDKELSAEGLSELAKQSNATAVICSDKLADKLAPVFSSMTLIRFSELDALIEDGKKRLSDGDRTYVDLPLNTDEMRELLFTSGTTGQSKGVMLSHKNICFNLSEMCRMVHVGSDDVFLSVLPLHHAFECTCGMLCQLSRGATVAFAEGLRQMTRNMQEVRPTVINCVPLFMEMIYKKIWANIRKQGMEKRVSRLIKVTNALPERARVAAKRKLFGAIHKSFGGRLRLMISCGAAAKPDVLKGLRDFGILAIQSYGVTECAPLAAINRDNRFHDASAGLATPNALLDIYDVHDDGTGEIRYKGGNVMLGYYNQPELTHEVLRDGWFYTGDLGYLDENGFLFITGRKKNSILTETGRHVSPEELELLLSKSPYVKDTVVVGILNEAKNDYDIVAIVQPDLPFMIGAYGKDYTPEQLDLEIKKAISEVNAAVPAFKRICSHILRREDFPKNTSGMIRRAPVIAEYVK